MVDIDLKIFTYGVCIYVYMIHNILLLFGLFLNF